jgi:hypothetical protein
MEPDRPPKVVRMALANTSGPPGGDTAPVRRLARAILDGQPLPPLSSFLPLASSGPTARTARQSTPSSWEVSERESSNPYNGIPTEPLPRLPSLAPWPPGLRPPEHAGPAPYDWVTVGSPKNKGKRCQAPAPSFAATAACAPPSAPAPWGTWGQNQTQLQSVATSSNPRPTLAIDADTRKHLMQASESELKALWKQRFGKPVPNAYKSKSSVVEAYLLSNPAGSPPRPRRAAAPQQLRNAEWTVTHGGRFAQADRMSLPSTLGIVRDIQRALGDAQCSSLTLLGGRWSSNEFSAAANFVLVFGGHPDPAEVMRWADVLASPFGTGSYLIPKAGFSRIRLFNVPIVENYDSDDDLLDELQRNPDVQALNLKFIDKPRWMFRPERRRKDRDQVIFTIFDPRNDITPKVLRASPFMFGSQCRAARFDSRPMLRQCGRCHKLGHLTERCPRPKSFVRCRLCGGGHQTDDHDDRCRTKSSHTARGSCSCPPWCYNCKDAGKPEKGHRVYDLACPLRAAYRTTFALDTEPKMGTFGGESSSDDARMASPALVRHSLPPAGSPSRGPFACIDDPPLALPASADRGDLAPDAEPRAHVQPST